MSGILKLFDVIMSAQSVYTLVIDDQVGHLIAICDVDFLPTIYSQNYDRFRKSYSHIRLTPNVDEILKKLLDKYKLKECYREFSTFIGYSSYLYSVYNQPMENDSVFQDFEKERISLSELLEYLRKFLNNEIQNKIDYLQIHQDDGRGIKIKNSFIINDILSAYCNSRNLTKDNFDERARMLLDSTNDLIWDKAGENVKAELLRSLYSYVHPKTDGSENSTYSFT